MAEVIRMPRMSDTMTEGVLASWLKKVGDKIKPGDILAEVETDKATMELESYWEGTILYIGAKEGDAVPVEGVIAIIGKEGEDYKDVLEKAQSDSKNKSEKPKEDDSKEAETAKKQEPSKEKASEKPEEESSPKAEKESTDSDASRLKASPLAKRIAQEKGYSLENIKGSGDQGRIIRRDVENFTPSSAAASTNLQVSGQEGYEDVRVSQMRKTIARRLAESKFSAPHYYLTIEINMERAIAARKSINEYLGSKVSFNDIVIKAAAAALKKHPKVNASWMEDVVRYYAHVHVGVAIAVEDGLVVPVVKFADQKSLSNINEEVKDFAEKAKNKKLQPQDFEGSTFTISNLGMFGIDSFTAIINPPAACILAIGAITAQPIVKDGQIIAGQIMKVTLSCDHRVVDGATGAQYLQTFKQYLEEPVTILA